jgi:hypothetical protein
MDLLLLEQVVAELPSTRLVVVSQVNVDLERVSDNVDGGVTYLFKGLRPFLLSFKNTHSFQRIRERKMTQLRAKLRSWHAEGLLVLQQST